MILSRCSICNDKKSSALARISQGSGIFDSLVYNASRDRMKDALLKAFR